MIIATAVQSYSTLLISNKLNQSVFMLIKYLLYSPKTRMKSVLRDTTQKTCSYKTKDTRVNSTAWISTYNVITQNICAVKKHN